MTFSCVQSVVGTVEIKRSGGGKIDHQNITCVQAIFEGASLKVVAGRAEEGD